MSLNYNGIKILTGPGSTNTLITENLRKILKLEGKSASLNLITVAGDKETISKMVKTKLGDRERDCFTINKLMTIESKPLNMNELWPNLNKEIKQDVLKNNVTGKNRHFSRPGRSLEIRS